MKNLNGEIDGEKESIVDKIIYTLFVKVNFGRRIRPKEGDSFEYKLFVAQGFWDMICVFSFYVWILYSFFLRIEIKTLGYILIFSLVITHLLRVIQCIHIKDYKWVPLYVIVTAIAVYAIYKFPHNFLSV
ncbi:MAG: hypothetical protein SVK08_02720 [Halobacteriota archaeon]|nr:hypothetical protein [Halobacteriota archaeon]